MVRILLTACLCCALPATAQVSGRFYLEKTQFSPTEPIFVYSKITNNSSVPIDLATPDTEQPMCAGVSNKVYRNGIKSPSCFDWAEEVCVINGGGWPSVRLMPGESHVDRYLLNYRHDLSIPGDYRVESERIGFPDDRLKTVRATLLFRVDAGEAPVSSYAIHTWVNQLHSSDFYKRTEAARTLATIAPRSIESTLLGFAVYPEFAKYAPLAFYRLRTTRSMQALADFVEGSKSEDFAFAEAERFLAQSGDQRWYPVLLRAAQKSRESADFTYAAELGGAASIPTPVEIASTAVDFASYGLPRAIMALGSTHSRKAIPILLEYLQSGDEAASAAASQGLRVLTHRIAFADSQPRDHRLEVAKWLDWWKHKGSTARIFRDHECGDLAPLP
jgi:hypothetical protein